MAAARVQTDRFMLKWRDMEPTRGTYDWSERDLLIGGLAFAGNPAGPVRVGVADLGGQRVPSRSPRSTAPPTRQAWRNFLKAAVARYGPGGTYWATKYDQQFGASATPLPIQSWQIWNEPNLKRYFSAGVDDPAGGQEVRPAARRSPTTRSRAKDPKATDRARRTVQHPHGGRSKAWDLPQQPSTAWPGSRTDFDAAALHPYGCNLDQTRTGISEVPRRDDEPRRRGHAAVDHRVRLGIGAPDQFCKNKGLTGQRDLLSAPSR